VSPDRYRGFGDAARFPVGENQELLAGPPPISAKILHAGAARILQSCRTFATLDDHARRLAGEFKLPPDQFPRLRSELAALVEGGQLVAYRRACELLGPPRPESPGGVTVVGVPTRDRPSSLERCLTAL